MGSMGHAWQESTLSLTVCPRFQWSGGRLVNVAAGPFSSLCEGQVQRTPYLLGDSRTKITMEPACISYYVETKSRHSRVVNFISIVDSC